MATHAQHHRAQQGNRGERSLTASKIVLLSVLCFLSAIMITACGEDESAAGPSRRGLSAAQMKRIKGCLLYTSPSPRDATLSRMPSSA